VADPKIVTLRGGAPATPARSCRMRMHSTAGSDIYVAVAQLSLPVERVHRSFLGSMAEFRAEGRGDLADHGMIGGELREFGHRWATPEGFAGYVGWLRAQVLQDSP
jgi:hypothetical protein